MHNGFDFLVCVEDVNYNVEGQRRNYPKHDDIKEDLLLKRAENIDMYKELYKVIKKVYECHDIKEAEYDNIEFTTGLPTDHILKTIKCE